MSDSHQHDSHHAHHHDDGLVHVHVHPVSLYIKVFAALIFFTLLTVAVAEVHLGEWNFFVAVVIATMKAALVALFFMHLKHARFGYQLTMGVAIVMVLVFIGLTAGDVAWRDVSPARTPTLGAPQR